MKATDPQKEAEKILWSLQNNYRTGEQRKLFQPNRKKIYSSKSTINYLLSVLCVLLMASFLFRFLIKEPVAVCLFEDMCIHSQQTPILYVLFIFFNLCVIIFGVYFAYRIGRFFGKKLQI